METSVMMEEVMVNSLSKGEEECLDQQDSVADLFLEVSRELARSDSRIYRSVGRHIARTREILERASDDLDQPLLQEEPDDLTLGGPSYERQTRKSLERLCRSHGIRRYSRMTKNEMICRLREAGVPTPPIPLDALTKKELIELHEDTVRRFSQQ
jgi:hypothetical protein